MPRYKKRQDYFESEEGIMVAEALQEMVSDARYMTDPSFSADTKKYSNNLIPFIDKHRAYLRDHPATDPQHYLSNLKIMTKIRI